MTKLNPLFVDSTKDNSDSVGMDIELSALLLREGESVYFCVRNHKGLNVEKEMEESAFGEFICQMWLNHQQEMESYFAIKKENKVVAVSPRYKIRGSYFFKKHWEEDKKGLEKLANQEFTPKNNSQFIAYQAVQSQEKEKDYWETQTAVTQAKSLLSKWGL